ncbi:MAG: outer membrane beta-barrel protein [Saprospiraceae bacterium]|nr:outer membrane beta-barrel protein [Saprospiraceae bacterium]MCB9324782.1 outer membrane beta-barrel protein [Lewinellaceae bacterium]
MANRYNNDDLEGFFNRRMKDYEEVPRPEMWDRIGASIPPKPPIAWWKKQQWWLGAVLAFILLLSLWQYQRLLQFEKIIDQQRADIEALKNDRSSRPEKGISGFDEVNPAASENLNEASYGEDKLLESNSTNGNRFNNPVATIANEPGNLNFIPHKILIAQETSSVETLPTKITELQPQLPLLPESVKKTGKVNFLGTQRFAMLEAPVLPFDQKVKIDPVKSKAGFYFSFNGGSLATFYNNPLNKSKNEVTASDVPGFHLSNTVRDEFTILAGIQFTKKWSLETGVGYRNNRLGLFDSQQFNYSGEHTISYDVDGNPVGSYTNNTDQSPVFRYQIVNNLQSQGMDIEDGETFQLDAFFKYNNRYLSLPLWLRYRIGNKRLHLYAKTGMAWNILTVSHKNLGDSNLSDERLTLEKVQIKNDALNESFLELGMASGVEYDLGLRSSIGMEALYYHSLASVLTTKQNAFGLSLALKYHF